MFVFRKILRALLSCYLRFEIRPFVVLTTIAVQVIGLNAIFTLFGYWSCHNVFTYFAPNASA